MPSAKAEWHGLNTALGGRFFLKNSYNEDAMVFSKMVKNYKVNSKFVKSIGTEVLSLGFPASETKKGHLTLQSILGAIEATVYKEEPYGIVFSLKMDIKQNYFEYFEEIQKSKNIVAEPLIEYKTTPENLLIKMIQDFDLANSTPM